MQISELYIYPVKSLAGIAQSQVKITDRGFEMDRRWMMVDQNGRFITQREYPRLCLLQTELVGDSIEVYDAYRDSRVQFPIVLKEGEEMRVTIWEDVCEAISPNTDIHEWFSAFLGIQVRLVYMPEHSRRPVDPDYSIDADINSFSDGYPILVIGQSSLDMLNSKLQSPVGMNRFRPNVVFNGGVPFEEDTWKKFKMGDSYFHGVKPCSRCILTTVDPECGQTGKEPLQTLATFRKTNTKIYFGQNVIPADKGAIIKLGDEIQVLERKRALQFD